MRGVATYLLAALLLMASCQGGKLKQAQTSAPTASQTITIDNAALLNGACDTLRFGRMRSGEIIAKQVRIENTSDKPLVITNHNISCGCLSVRYDRKPTQKGESQTLDIEFDSRTMYGLQLKSLVLHLAQMEQPIRIIVEAEVE